MEATCEWKQLISNLSISHVTLTTENTYFPPKHYGFPYSHTCLKISAFKVYIYTRTLVLILQTWTVTILAEHLVLNLKWSGKHKREGWCRILHLLTHWLLHAHTAGMAGEKSCYHYQSLYWVAIMVNNQGQFFCSLWHPGDIQGQWLNESQRLHCKCAQPNDFPGISIHPSRLDECWSYCADLAGKEGDRWHACGSQTVHL